MNSTNNKTTIYASQFPDNDNYHTYVLISYIRAKHTKYHLTERSVDTEREQFIRLMQGEEMHHVKIPVGSYLEKLYNNSTKEFIPSILVALITLIPTSLIKWIAKWLLGDLFNQKEYAAESVIVILDRDPVGILSAMATDSPHTNDLYSDDDLYHTYKFGDQGKRYSIRDVLALLLDKQRHPGLFMSYLKRYYKGLPKPYVKIQELEFNHIVSEADLKTISTSSVLTRATAYAATLKNPVHKLRAADILQTTPGKVSCVNYPMVGFQINNVLRFLHLWAQESTVKRT